LRIARKEPSRNRQKPLFFAVLHNNGTTWRYRNTLIRAGFALEKTSFAPGLRSKKHRLRPFCARKTSFAPANPLLPPVCTQFLSLDARGRTEGESLIGEK
jgi:hypothetical protein